jgi:hypothetical protein
MANCDAVEKYAKYPATLDRGPGPPSFVGVSQVLGGDGSRSPACLDLSQPDVDRRQSRSCGAAGQQAIRDQIRELLAAQRKCLCFLIELMPGQSRGEQVPSIGLSEPGDQEGADQVIDGGTGDAHSADAGVVRLVQA